MAVTSGLATGYSPAIRGRCNRLMNHTLTGKQVNLNQLGTVPNATNAVNATSATSATNATNAVNATNATSSPVSKVTYS